MGTEDQTIDIKLREAFKKFDTTERGFLSSVQIRKILLLNISLSAKEIEQLIDQNVNDNSEVNYEGNKHHRKTL